MNGRNTLRPSPEFWEVRSMDEKEYLETLTGQIRCRRARPLVEEEIRSHMEDQAEAYRLNGMDEKEARKRAVLEMGDPVEAGAMLDRVHRPKMEWSVLILVLLLGFVGIFVQFAQGGVQSGRLLYMTAGLAVMLVIYRLDYTFLGKYTFLLWLLLLGLSWWCRYLPAAGGRQRAGAYAVCMLAVPVYAAILFRLRGKGYVVLPLAGFMLLLQLSAAGATGSGSAVLQMALICCFLFITAVGRGWYKVRKKPVLAAAVFFLASLFILPVLYALYFHDGLDLLADYQAERIRAMLTTSAYPENYHIREVRSVIKSASLWGNRDATIANHIANIPEEYIMTWVFSYFGIAAGALVVGLFLCLIWRCLRSVWRQKNELGSMIGLASVSVLGLQGFIYILSNIWGSAVAQFNMPFISGGWECILMNYILAGLLLSIYGNSNIVDERAALKKKKTRSVRPDI